MRMKTQDVWRAHEPGLVVGMVTGCEVPLLMCLILSGVYVRTSRKTTFFVSLPCDVKTLRPDKDFALETATYN